MVWVLTEGSLLVVINFETSFFISLSNLFTMPLMAAEDNSSMLTATSPASKSPREDNSSMLAA